MKDYVILLILILLAILGILIYEVSSDSDKEALADPTHNTTIYFKSILDKSSLNTATIQMPDGSNQTTSTGTKQFNSSAINEQTLTFRVNGYMDLEVYFENTYNLQSMTLYFEPTPAPGSPDDSLQVARIVSNDLPSGFLVAEMGSGLTAGAPTLRYGNYRTTVYEFALGTRDMVIVSMGNRNQVYFGLRRIKDSARVDVVLDNCMGMMGN